MLMKKKSLISLVVLGVLFNLFVAIIAPDISRPLTIIGFFTIFTLLIANTAYFGLMRIKERSRRVVWSVSLAAFAGYLVALSSLKLFTLSQFVLTSVALLALLFIVEKSYAR
jgi:hypothetical protein